MLSCDAAYLLVVLLRPLFVVAMSPLAPRPPLLPSTQVLHEAGSNASLMRADISCIEYTGGTCMVQPCSAWRGPTECSVGRCFCRRGYCSSADGECYSESNKEIAAGFMLRNARWPEQYMYVPKLSRSLWTSRRVNDQSKFNLYQLPGQESGNGLVEYLLGSAKYTNYVATIRRQEVCSGGDSGGCHIENQAVIVPITRVSSSAVEDMAVNLVLAPQYEGAPNGSQSVMIESFLHPGYYMYLSRMSWSVGSYKGDAGVGSYWIPEPSLPLHLTSYRGYRCTYDCGSYGSRSSGVSGVILIIVGAAIGIGVIVGVVIALRSVF